MTLNLRLCTLVINFDQKEGPLMGKQAHHDFSHMFVYRVYDMNAFPTEVLLAHNHGWWIMTLYSRQQSSVPNGSTYTVGSSLPCSRPSTSSGPDFRLGLLPRHINHLLLDLSIQSSGLDLLGVFFFLDGSFWWSINSLNSGPMVYQDSLIPSTTARNSGTTT